MKREARSLALTGTGLAHSKPTQSGCRLGREAVVNEQTAPEAVDVRLRHALDASSLCLLAFYSGMLGKEPGTRPASHNPGLTNMSHIPTCEHTGNLGLVARNGGSPTAAGLSNNSPAVKVGLGVGLGLGIPLACGAIMLVYFIRQRRRRGALASSLTENDGGKSPVSPMTEDDTGSAAGPDQNQGYWQDGVWAEKTMTEYYADGAGPGARYGRQNKLRAHGSSVRPV